MKVLIGQVRDPSGSVQLFLTTVLRAQNYVTATPCASRIKMWSTSPASEIDDDYCLGIYYYLLYKNFFYLVHKYLCNVHSKYPIWPS